MSDSELKALREWSAKQCGYERNLLNVNTAARYFNAGREWFVTAWLPDQNIAQAFEVAEAMKGQYCVACHGAFYSASACGKQGVVDSSPSLALLRACKVAANS